MIGLLKIVFPHTALDLFKVKGAKTIIVYVKRLLM